MTNTYFLWKWRMRIMKIGLLLNICIFVLTVLLLAVVEWVGLLTGQWP